ncbi:MAG: response regulator [Rhizobiaceae bacterium]|nr:response regulator [Rhizobiaceae bacterium]MCV0407761.1 response regulator [Rhizobiaceae bacterium]
MKRCMIIDDSSVIRKVARRILHGPDMEIVEAGTGREALAMCAVDMPEIVVVDATLPDIELVDFVRQVRAIEAPVVPDVYICMPELELGTIMRAKRAGAKGYILKPFDRSQLLQRFRQLQQKAA